MVGLNCVMLVEAQAKGTTTSSEVPTRAPDARRATFFQGFQAHTERNRQRLEALET